MVQKVRVLDNLVNGFESNLDVLRLGAFEFIEGDIRNAGNLSAGMQRY